jgi:hypothetical protein
VSDDPATSAERPRRPPTDPVAAAAVVSGLLGIVVFGLLLVLVTAFLGAWAGQRARDAGRSLENAYLVLGLAVLDGAVWLVLHFLFDLPFAAG